MARIIGEHPSPVRRRLLALVRNHEARSEVDGEQRAAYDALAARQAAALLPLAAARRALVDGSAAVKESAGDAEAVEDDFESAAGGESSTSKRGLPGFWLQALLMCPEVEQSLSDRDRQALSYCQDVSCAELPGQRGFVLSFAFDAAANPFFGNAVLSKRYEVPNMGACALTEGGCCAEEPMLEDVEGSVINWRDAGHNLCERAVKRKQKGRAGRKGSGGGYAVALEKTPSFFHFFAPPAMPADEEEAEQMGEEQLDATQDALQQDFGLGLVFRNKLVPHAVMYYLGMVEDSEDEDEDYEDEDGSEEEEAEEEEEEEEEGDDSEGEGWDGSEEGSEFEGDELELGGEGGGFGRAVQDLEEKGRAGGGGGKKRENPRYNPAGKKKGGAAKDAIAKDPECKQQ